MSDLRWWVKLTITHDVDDAERDEPAGPSSDEPAQDSTADAASSENQQVTTEAMATRLVINEWSSRRRVPAIYYVQII